MRKLILTICFCLIVSTVWADEMLYVRTYNRPGVTRADDAGRSKKGDIVDIYKMPHTPTKTSMKEWAFVVVPDLTPQAKAVYLETYEDKEELKAYRKKILDVDALELKVGQITKLNSLADLTTKLRDKNETDFLTYDVGRIAYNIKRPFIRLTNIVTKKAFAETVSKICAVGDNCTDENYNTITDWEDAKDGDLETDTRQETAEVYDDDGSIADNFNINGSTTTSEYYMKITAPVGERHDGTLSGGGALIVNSGKSNWDDSYIVVEWLILDGNTNTSGDNFELDYASYITVRNNVIRGGRYWILDVDDPCHHVEIYNNIIMSGVEEGDAGIHYDNGIGAGNLAYNNTIINCERGIYNIDSTSDDVTAINNIVQLKTGNTACYAGNFNSNSTNNLGDDATAPEYGTYYDNIELTFSGAGDYHLDATDTDAIDKGIDLGTTYSIDIDGDDRDASATWDLGADEIVEVAGSHTTLYGGTFYGGTLN